MSRKISNYHGDVSTMNLLSLDLVKRIVEASWPAHMFDRFASLAALKVVSESETTKTCNR